MKRGVGFLTGFGLGAATMYVMDPVSGRRRRTLVRDRASSAASDARDYVGAAWSDARNRAQGVAARAKSRFEHDEADDRVIEERVRAKLGRWVSHPHAVDVEAHRGRVVLRGDILGDEIADLLTVIRDVRGVNHVHNELTAHDHPGDIPSLQGGRTIPGEPSEWRQRNWAPSARFLAGTAGGTLLTWALARPSFLAPVLGTAGLALLARSLANRSVMDLVRSGHQSLRIDKTIEIDAPVNEVFRYWSRYENFPRFMAHVREVRDLGNGRSHWIVDGPAGTRISWDAKIGTYKPNRAIAWTSFDSPIKNAGIVHFTPLSGGRTRVRLRFSFDPPAGLAGHFIGLLGKQRQKRAIDEDLLRFKSLIEDGSTSAPGKRVTRETLATL